MESETTQHVGTMVREAREAQELSIAKLAEAADVDPRWLSRLEHGVYRNPDPRLLDRLAKVVGLETLALFEAADYTELPGFAPYLRTKYDLGPEEIAQLAAHFELLVER